MDQVGSFKEVNYAINRDFNRMKFYEVDTEKLVFTDGVDTVLYSFGANIVRQQGARVDSIPIQGALVSNDSITTLTLMLGERKTNIRLPIVNSGVLSYWSSELGTTEEITE